jgi:hypothetical protein
MRIIDFAEKDLSHYLSFYGYEEFENISEQARSVGVYHEFMMSIQWIQILQNLFFLRCFRGDLFSRTCCRAFDYYISIIFISFRILQIVRIV